MGRKKKKKPLPPRTKRMNRKQRLQSAPHWIAQYEGSHIVRSYRRRYGVDWLCAVKELQLMGIEIDPEYVTQLQRTVDEQAKKKREKRVEPEKTCPPDWSQRYPYAEGDMYFVAGHTSNGAP